VIDSHFHLFRRKAAKQSGILAAGYLQRDITWRAYAQAWRGLDIEACVAVQVNDFVDGRVEADYLGGIARRHPALKAIVAWGQLEAAGASDQVRELRRLPLVRGVRRGTQHEADPTLAGSAAFIAGAQNLAGQNLVCEVCVKSFQLEGVVRLAEAAPEATIVVNHLGKPDLEATDQAAWRAGMRRLGRLPNVFCKVSVVVHTERDPKLTRSLVEPFITEVVDAFGWDRVMFGSNWPVATAVVGYVAWVEMLNDILAGASAADLAKLYAATARRVYGIA
jgi:L-fuconolactonase